MKVYGEVSKKNSYFLTVVMHICITIKTIYIYFSMGCLIVRTTPDSSKII